MALDDNGPLLAGVTWSLCLVSGFFLGLRLYAKISRKHPLWWDDHVLIFSWVLLLIESIITQIGIALGLGKHTNQIPPINLFITAVGLSIGTTITCFASTLSKISFGVTLLRLTSGYTRAFVWFCIVSLFIVMLPSAFMLYLTCRPLMKMWNPTIEGDCWDPQKMIRYGYFNAAWCASADFALALLPWKLIWELQLTLRDKIGVSIAMSMGLLAGVCAIVKGVYLGQIGQEDFTYNGKDVIIWTAVETATAIIGGSIPVLRVFFKETISSRSHHTTRSTQGVSLSTLQGPTHDKNYIPNQDPGFLRGKPTGVLKSNSHLGDRSEDDELGILHEGSDSDESGIEYVMDAKGRIVPTVKAISGGVATVAFE